MATRITDLIDVQAIEKTVYHVKKILAFIFTVALVYGTWIMVPILDKTYRFEEAIQTKALEAAYNDQEEYQIHDDIMQQAKNFGVPVKEENVLVTRGENAVRIQAKYDMPIYLPMGHTLTLTFSPASSEKTLSHEAIQIKKAKENK